MTTTHPMAGSVRVVSKRQGGTAALTDETVIDVDRVNPVLGNRHILRNHHDDAERAVVIGAYEADFEADVARKGPMFQAVMALAARAAGGERLALRCWCAPKACHADLLAANIAELALVQSLTPTNN